MENNQTENKIKRKAKDELAYHRNKLAERLDDRANALRGLAEQAERAARDCTAGDDANYWIGSQVRNIADIENDLRDLRNRISLLASLVRE